jgi:hypothetical protein
MFVFVICIARKSIYERTIEAFKKLYGDDQSDSDVEANSEEGIPLQEIQNNTATICSSCEDQSEALFNCRECKATLCSECNQAHSRLKLTLTQNHNVTTLNAEPSIE